MSVFISFPNRIFFAKQTSTNACPSLKNLMCLHSTSAKELHGFFAKGNVLQRPYVFGYEYELNELILVEQLIDFLDS